MFKKDPATDPGKASKRGRVTLFKGADGEYFTDVEDCQEDQLDQLETYFEDGEIKFTQTFEQVRANSKI